jgi:hypothetical protein
VSTLDWHQTKWGYECPGYRVVAESVGESQVWRLEHVGDYSSLDRGEVRVSVHRRFEDAVQWAEIDERDRLRRMVAFGHFLIAAVSLALFVLLAQFIGSLGGLALVAGAFYLTLRSVGNGLGVVLHEAWGWTRSGARQPKPTIMERLVVALARRVRHRQLAATQLSGDAVIRELAPGPRS